MTPVPEHVRQALARWEAFPVRREPRPIVLAGSTPDLHRLSDDPRWVEVLGGEGVAASELPPELLPAARAHCLTPVTQEERPWSRIVRADGPFGTDRGLRWLPAWVVFPPGTAHPAILLDPEYERRMTWQPEGVSWSSADEAVLQDDGWVLTYRFLGTPPSYAHYPRAEVFETDTAVFVEPVEVPLVGPEVAQLTWMQPHEVVVRLAAPLGNRVLIDARGSTVTVVNSPVGE